MKKIICIFLILTATFGRAQSFFEPADSLNKKRTIGVSILTGGTWVGTIAGLNFVWYKDFNKSKFHAFDDGHEWCQMDKVGHAATAWYFSRLTGGLYNWAGVDRKKSSLIAAGFSFGYMATFEILDGFSADWGFSFWDIGANTAGALSYWGQEFAWQEQKFKFKFSVHTSGLALYRPNVLGADFASRTLKDYNGQTYWLSFNPVTIIKPDSRLPKWLNISFGYSVQDQLIGDGSTYVYYDGSTQLNFTPYRQFFLSLDIDFEDLPVKNKFLKAILKGINVFKMPFPALEMNQNGLKFRPFYF